MLSNQRYLIFVLIQIKILQLLENESKMVVVTHPRSIQMAISQKTKIFQEIKKKYSVLCLGYRILVHITYKVLSKSKMEQHNFF